MLCTLSINFEQTIKLLKSRGKAMQNAVPKGEGGMIAVLGVEINELKNIKDKMIILNVILQMTILQVK